MPNNIRWLRGYEYNMTRVLERIADMILAEGGRVDFRNEGMEIRTRGYAEPISNACDTIDRIKDVVLRKFSKLTDEQAEKLLAEKEAELAKLKAKEESAPVIQSRLMTQHGCCALYLKFVLGDTLYSLDMDENPFMDDHYLKARIDKEGKVLKQHYREEFGGKRYIYNELLSPCADEATVEETAANFLDLLKQAPYSGTYNETRTVEVANKYNDGTHKEIVPANVRVPVGF